MESDWKRLEIAINKLGKATENNILHGFLPRFFFTWKVNAGKVVVLSTSTLLHTPSARDCFEYEQLLEYQNAFISAF